MAYDIALEKALNDLKELSPYVAASKCGIDFAENRFKIKFFNRTFYVSFPDGNVEELDVSTPPPQWLHLILLHYLIHADGSGIADEWIPYRHLPGAGFFERRFVNMTIGPLAKAFGEDLEGFNRAGLALGGMPMDRTGDAAFRFHALPRIPLGCILYLGDEEVQPAVNVLFDASASAYLPTEDLSIVGAYLNTMQKYRTVK